MSTDSGPGVTRGSEELGGAAAGDLDAEMSQPRPAENPSPVSARRVRIGDYAKNLKTGEWGDVTFLSSTRVGVTLHTPPHRYVEWPREFGVEFHEFGSRNPSNPNYGRRCDP